MSALGLHKSRSSPENRLGGANTPGMPFSSIEVDLRTYCAGPPTSRARKEMMLRYPKDPRCCSKKSTVIILEGPVLVDVVVLME